MAGIWGVSVDRLTDSLYKELDKYRVGSRIKDNQNHLQTYLAEEKLIETAKTEFRSISDSEYVIETVEYKLSQRGKLALEAEDKMREQDAKRESSKNFRYVFDIVFGIICAILGALLQKFFGS